MSEPCPPHLDAEGRTMWEHCSWIAEGGKFEPGVTLQLQALAIRRELRLESRENGAMAAFKLIEADPHQWSSRPCQTCRAVSLLIGRDFGCNAAKKQ